MKKFLLILAFLCIVYSSNATVPIRVLDTTQQSGTTHRAPTTIPVSADYLSSISSLMLFFNQDCGAVGITINNISTGDSEYYSFNASIGTYYFPIQNGVGNYIVYITLSNDITLFGEFSVE